MAKQKTSRKAFATTAAAVMAATAVTPVAAFAASKTSFPDVPAGEYADAINNLAGQGILNGFDDGTFKPNDPVLREQAAKILATALKLDTTGTENYPDVSPDNWSYKYIVAVTKAGIFGGDEKGNFNPFANLTRQEAAKIIVEAFGFTGSTELTFGDKANIQSWAVPYVKTAVANGILKGDDQGNFNPNANIKRGDFALMIQRALNAVENAKTPKVESVSANNLKTVNISFNKPVDKETIDFSTVKVSKGSTTYTDTELNYVLSDDKKTLTVVFDTVSNLQSDEFKVVVDGVKTVDGEAFSKAEFTKSFLDTTIPTIDNVKVVNPKIVEIYTSEPVQLSSETFTNLSSIKVDGVNAIAKVTPDYVNNKYTVEFNNVLSAGQHTITVSDIKDFANFKAADASFTVSVTADTTAPSVVSAKVIDKDTVEVKFSEAVATSGSNVVGTLKINDKPYVGTLKEGTVDTVVIDGISPVLDLAALVQVKFEYVGVKDVIGNEVKETQTFLFKADDDTTAPTVTAELVTKAGELNNLKLKFSKEVATDVGSIELRDKDNKVVVTLSASDADWSEDNKVATFTASQLKLNNVNPAQYTLKVKDFVDTTLRANKIGETTVSLNAVDTKKPTVNTNYTEVRAESNNENARIKISFNEAMDESTLKNLANYHVGTVSEETFSGTRLDQVTGAKIVEVAGDKKSVIIELPKASYDETNSATSVIKVEGLRDLAGNLIDASLVTSAKALEALQVVEGGIKATGSNTIEVTFNRAVGTVDPSVFTVQDEDDTAFTNISNAVIDADNPETVILTTVSKLPSDLKIGEKDLELDIKGSTKLKDVYGVAFEDDALDNEIDDEIKPEISSFSVQIEGEEKARTVTINSDRTAGTIDLSSIADDAEIKEVNITASEAATLEVLLPLISKIQQVTGIGSEALPINKGEDTYDVKNGITLETLKDLALIDGDGSSSTLTLTSTLKDESNNVADMKLVITVK
ncbi:S-layer homology domain-containing protein [Caldifermentibacillus hisashii]|uniref:S-layer homology domain-containing protein n=1 Tax=Caldifermentibacillus hisashii TaxID=996558 RepID=UPI0031FDD115